MRIAEGFSLACVVALILTGPVAAAQNAQGPPLPSSTTRLIPISGTLADSAGTPLSGAQTVTLALFDEAEGGTLLWSEPQTVTADERGRYVVYLGAAVALPLEMFRSETARWLQVSVAGRDLPRVMLVAVPYALKAADAETVGGKPASAFVLAGDRTAEAKATISVASSVIDPLVTAGTPGRLAVFTTATDLGDSVVFQTGTDVGVGTAAPAAPFHVAASQTPAAFFDVYNDALGALPVVFRAARGTPAVPAAVQTNDILGGLAVRGYGATGFTGGKGQVMFRAAENWTDTANGTYLQFTTTPSGSSTFAERMRIDPSGRVLIGTAFSSDARLRVVTSSGGPLVGILGESYVGGGEGVRGFAENGVGVIGHGNKSYGVYASSNEGMGLLAYSGGATIATFVGPGNVGIGTVGDPLDRLHVAGDIRVGTDTTGCVKDANGTVIAGTCSSDRRFKQAVTPFARSLEAVARLQPVSFTWRADEYPDRHFGRTRSFGLIAQDVEAVLPELVTTDEKGYKAVKYNQLPFYMLQAIKDLKAETDRLKSESDLLTADNDRLKSESDRVKQHLKAYEARLQRLEQLADK